MLTAAMVTTSPHAPYASAAAAPGDEQVQKLLMLALDHISRGLCENKKPCAPATAEEKANPPITIAEARVVIRRGVLSAAGQHCGLDWRQRNYLPMMAYWRQQAKKNERQMALIGLLHGIMQGMGKPDPKLVCTADMRANLDRQLSFRL